jgi:hypothetical protein
MPGSDTAATSQYHGDGGDADDDFLTVLHEGFFPFCASRRTATTSLWQSSAEVTLNVLLRNGFVQRSFSDEAFASVPGRRPSMSTSVPRSMMTGYA